MQYFCVPLTVQAIDSGGGLTMKTRVTMIVVALAPILIASRTE